MAFSFVLIFEPVVAELARVLLFHLMGSKQKENKRQLAPLLSATPSKFQVMFTPLTGVLRVNQTSWAF